MSHSVLPAAEPTPMAPPSKTRIVLQGVLLAALVLFVAECLRIFAGSNFHAVVPGQCFRSAQPSASLLEDVQRTHGIRTVINLRDENKDEPWYQEEEEALTRLKVKLINAGLSSTEQPPVEDFRHFVAVMRDAQGPILIHCANGNDRTGLASAVYLLLHTKTSIADARGQLSLRYGHFAWGKASCLNRILDSYEAWLEKTGKTHDADNLYFWGMEVYRPEPPR